MFQQLFNCILKSRDIWRLWSYWSAIWQKQTIMFITIKNICIYIWTSMKRMKNMLQMKKHVKY